MGKTRIRLTEDDLRRIVMECVEKTLSEGYAVNEAWYNNWGDFKRGARKAGVGLATAAALSGPMASCSQPQQATPSGQPRKEYSMKMTPKDQMGKDICDIFSNHPVSSQEIMRKWGDSITDSFVITSGNDIPQQKVEQYQRVGAKWTLVGSNGDGTYTVFFLR